MLRIDPIDAQRPGLFGRITMLPGALQLCLGRNSRRDIELVDVKNWRHANPGRASFACSGSLFGRGGVRLRRSAVPRQLAFDGSLEAGRPLLHRPKVEFAVEGARAHVRDFIGRRAGRESRRIYDLAKKDGLFVLSHLATSLLRRESAIWPVPLVGGGDGWNAGGHERCAIVGLS